jgi:hypothetical protein
MKMTAKKIVIIGLAIAFLFSFADKAMCQKQRAEKIIIKVKNNTIDLPGGDVAKVPLSSARVRSTPLRDLNRKHNAVSLEKLFELEDKRRNSMIKGLRSIGDVNEEAVDLSSVFTKKIKKQMEAEGKKTVEVKNVYLLHFAFEPDEVPDMDELLSEYQEVDVVVYTKYIQRRK